MRGAEIDPLPRPSHNTGHLRRPSHQWRAWAVERDTDERLDGPWITIAMAKAEGWYKNDKWKNMPELMMRYRAGAWWGRTYAPEITMGLQTVEEVHDVHNTIDITPQDNGAKTAAAAALNAIAEKKQQGSADTVDDPQEPDAEPEQPAATYDNVKSAIQNAATADELQQAKALIGMLDDTGEKDELDELAADRLADL